MHRLKNWQLFAICVLTWGTTWFAITFQIGHVAPEVGVAMRFALAMECVHTYSLVHDDLPAMDDDDLRRGRPTVHKAFDDATAVLVGDGLQSLAFRHLLAADGPVIIDLPQAVDAAGNNHAQRMLLRDGRRPILAYVGRLDTQKGLHLIRHALFYALEQDAQFVLLGSGSEHGINEDFWHLKRHLNDNPDVHLELSYDDYIIGALILYVDIMMLFIELLKIFGRD